MKIDERDPLYEVFEQWREGKGMTDTIGAPPVLDAALFSDYAESLLDELEAMASELELDELSGSLSLCKNVARLSGGGD